MSLFKTAANYDGMDPPPALEKGMDMVTDVTPLAQAGRGGGWMGAIWEPFAGAWQRYTAPVTPANMLAFSAVYSCVALISGDIAKLRIKMMEEGKGGVWKEVGRASPLAAVLNKPNRYQTRLQFIQMWIAWKLLHGNAYQFKERDSRGVVTALYPLNPFYVTPLVASDGSVFYRIDTDSAHTATLAGVDQSVTVPADAIIHDRGPCLWHPLVGVSPIYACAGSTTQGLKIQANSARFFQNMSRPSGQLTSPGTIPDATAKRLKEDFEHDFGQGNLGRILVAGDGLKYEPMSMTPTDSQLIEQLKWTTEDVARAFNVPLYKLGGSLPASFNSVSALNQDYYSQTLQLYIEAVEALLNEGLELGKNPPPYSAEMDLEGLLRMDPQGRAEANKSNLTSGVMAPNEARRIENLEPVPGGDAPFMQNQMWPISELVNRATPAAPTPALPAPPSSPEPASSARPPAKTYDAEEFHRELADEVRALLEVAYV
jgi:HK97 family phage portal protein